MKTSEYYRQREAEWLDLARYYGRVPEDAQKASGAKEAREQAAYYRAQAEAAEAEERAEEAQSETESVTQTESAEERTTYNMNKEDDTMSDTYKTTTDIEIEIQRNNVTPAQFLAYVRSRVDAKGGKWYRSDLDLAWFKRGDDRWNCDYSFGLPGEKGAASERIIDRPYEKQTYIMHFDGSVYNEIVEFDFWDEKTGFGYYYLVNKTAAPEDADHNARLHYESVKRYNEREIERTERKIAEKKERLDREREWLSKFWIEMEERDIRTMGMEIENRLDDIAECDELLGIKKEGQTMTEENKPTAESLPGYDPDLDTLHAEMVEAGEIEEEDFEVNLETGAGCVEFGEPVTGDASEESDGEEQTAEQIVTAVTEKVEQTKPRSAWDRGVKAYAEDLLEELAEAVAGGWIDAGDLCNRHLFERAMLNGASDWKQYSEGGCAFCYDGQIAKRLCAPWELRKTDNGRKDPNPRENWIDVQSRALYQAANLILSAAF